MENAKRDDVPFSARYALPAHISRNLGEVSWESVIDLSGDFQSRVVHSDSKVKKVIKELQMTRLLLLERIRESSGGKSIDPRLLVDVVRLLQRCEEVSAQYELDLAEFANFLYLVTEKLKREKLAHHRGSAEIGHISPMEEELSLLKGRSELARNRKKTAQWKKR